MHFYSHDVVVGEFDVDSIWKEKSIIHSSAKLQKKNKAWNYIQVLMNYLKFGVQTGLYATLPILGS